VPFVAPTPSGHPGLQLGGVIYPISNGGEPSGVLIEP
jgi:hypothetical protein